jgi:hypothetical protein
MKSKRILLVMLAMVLAFGMTVVGCGKFVVYIEITNETAFPVTEVLLKDNSGTAQNDDESGMNPNSTKIYEVHSDYSGTIELTVTVGGENKTVTSSLTVPNKSESTIKYVLSGNGTNLQLTKK